MVAALNHRGPDSSDIWTSGNGYIGLGHARLAIVDLSEHGHQPMVSHSNRYVIVFNGEIYNHFDLRADLGTSVAWRGHSDTETLLEAIDQWGLVKALQSSVGMFALALWDRQTDCLSLARDRIGEKPLYYGRGSQGMAFASELKALHLVPGIDLTLNTESLRDYLRVGYLACPHSVYRGVMKLPPGTILTLKSPQHEGSIDKYWNLPEPIEHSNSDIAIRNDESWLNELENLLDRSVSQQMLSDVPIGAFLSGGIDSSLIVALMQRTSSQRVRTFSMGFCDKSEDESRNAREIAKHLGTDHTELIVTPDDALSVIPDLATIYDEPFADSSQIPTILLSRLTRKYVTVALSGDAGDELFGGYNRYLTAAHLMSINANFPLAFRRSLARAIRAIPPQWWNALSTSKAVRSLLKLPPVLDEKMARLASFISAPNGQQAYLGTISQWLDPSAIPYSIPVDFPQLPKCSSDSLPQLMMWWDLQSYLPDDILVKVDRAAMASSLETRVPFLDHRIVEFAMAAPLKYKIRNGKTKWMLRQLLARHVPSKLFERPKQGFSLPIDEWLRGPLRDWAEELLKTEALDDLGLLVTERVRMTWKDHLSRKSNNYRSLWTVLMLQAWFQAQKKTQVCLSQKPS